MGPRDLKATLTIIPLLQVNCELHLLRKLARDPLLGTQSSTPTIYLTFIMCSKFTTSAV